MSDIQEILRENNLSLIETEFFRQKKHVVRVRDSFGNKFILKTDKIEPFQFQLLKTAKLIEAQFLNDFYDKKPDWCLVFNVIVDDFCSVSVASDPR